jgi:hypothetical protein
MATAEVQIELLEEERKPITEAINDCKKKRNVLAHTIKLGAEDRAVRCEWQPDYEEKILRLVRVDTGVEIDVRKMNEADLQRSLDEIGDDHEVRLDFDGQGNIKPRISKKKPGEPVIDTTGDAVDERPDDWDDIPFGDSQVDQIVDGPPKKRGRGRPKGSKNKHKGPPLLGPGEHIDPIEGEDAAE